MKKSPLRNHTIGSLLLVVGATTSLLTPAFSLDAQEPSVTEAKTLTLPVNKVIATVNVGLAGTNGLVITPDSNTLYDGDVGFFGCYPDQRV
jgi:hypothetical protein